MKLSVVVTAYNYGRFLRGCLNSVAAQVGVDWECVVVDDGSTDDTPEIVAERCAGDVRFTSVRQDNRGLSAARNAGIEAAQGDWVAFLDADDQYYPGALKTLAESAAGVMVAGLTNYQPTPQSEPRFVQGAKEMAGFVHPVLTCFPSTVAVRRDVLSSIGGFVVQEGREVYPTIEDRALWIQVAARGPVVLVNQVVTWYRRGHAESLQSAGQADGRVLSGAVKLYADLLDDQALHDALGRESEDFNRLCRAHLLNGRSVQAALQREPTAGRLWDEALAACHHDSERQALVKALIFLIPGPRFNERLQLESRAGILHALSHTSQSLPARRLLRRALCDCLVRLAPARLRAGQPGRGARAALNAWLRSPTLKTVYAMARRSVASRRRKPSAPPPFQEEGPAT